MLKRAGRLLPTRGCVPKPREDIQQAPWLDHIRSGEVALFCVDSKTGQLLTLAGEVPQTPISEYCVACPNRSYAKRVAHGCVATHPNMVCALYTSKGKWLEIVSVDGVRQRNEDLGFVLLLLRFPLWILIGSVEIMLFLAIHGAGDPDAQFHWSASADDWIAIVVAGFFLGAATHGIFYLSGLALIYLQARPASQPFGSPAREAFYKQLASEPNLLVPKDITFEAVQIEWQDPEYRATWIAVLEQQSFQHVGQYRLPEVGVELEFWIKPDENLTAKIVNFPSKKMWIEISTDFQDRSSFGVANKDRTVLDPTRRKRPSI
jgi:hypothetical protein